jgi:hypothetical protein
MDKKQDHRYVMIIANMTSEANIQNQEQENKVQSEKAYLPNFYFFPTFLYFLRLQRYWYCLNLQNKEVFSLSLKYKSNLSIIALTLERVCAQNYK